MHPFEVILAGLRFSSKKPCPICGELMDAEDQEIMGGCIDCLRRREWQFDTQERSEEDGECSRNDE